MSLSREQHMAMLRKTVAELNDTSVDCMLADWELQAMLLEDELATLCKDKARLIEQLGLIADKADNFLCAAKLPMPPHVHVIGLKGGMEDIAKAARSAMSAPAGGKNDKT